MGGSSFDARSLFLLLACGLSLSCAKWEPGGSAELDVRSVPERAFGATIAPGSGTKELRLTVAFTLDAAQIFDVPSNAALSVASVRVVEQGPERLLGDIWYLPILFLSDPIDGVRRLGPGPLGDDGFAHPEAQRWVQARGDTPLHVLFVPRPVGAEQMDGLKAVRSVKLKVEHKGGEGPQIQLHGLKDPVSELRLRGMD